MKIPIDLALRALDSADADKARAWRNDMRIMRWCRQRDVISDVDQSAWFERQSRDPSIQMYGVWLKTGSGSELVGVAGLTSLDWPHRRAEFSYYTAPERQRQGIARAALTILLTHAFENLGLEQVWGEVLDGNPALKLFADLGFQSDGKRRGWYFKAGAFHDAHLISITRSEFHGRGSRDTLAPVRNDPGSDVDDAASKGAAARRAGAEKRGRRRGVAAVVAGAEPQDASGGPGRYEGSDPGSQGTRAATE